MGRKDTQRYRTNGENQPLYTRAQLDAEVANRTEAVKRQASEKFADYLQEFDKTHVPVETVNRWGWAITAQVEAYEVAAMAKAYATTIQDKPELLKYGLEQYGIAMEKLIDKIVAAYGEDGPDWRKSQNKVRVDLDAVLDCLKAGDGAALLALVRTKDPIAAGITDQLAEYTERERKRRNTTNRNLDNSPLRLKAIAELKVIYEKEGCGKSEARRRFMRECETLMRVGALPADQKEIYDYVEHLADDTIDHWPL